MTIRRDVDEMRASATFFYTGAYTMFHVSLSGKDITHKFDTLPEALLWIARQGDEFELQTYHIWSAEENRPVGSLTV